MSNHRNPVPALTEQAGTRHLFRPVPNPPGTSLFRHVPHHPGTATRHLTCENNHHTTPVPTCSETVRNTENLVPSQTSQNKISHHVSAGQRLFRLFPYYVRRGGYTPRHPLLTQSKADR